MLRITTWHYTGFILFLFAMVTGIWLLCSLVVFVRQPELIRPRIGKLALWTTTVLIAIGVQWYYAAEARATADEYLQTIERYKSQHSSYPKDLQAAGLDTHRARKILLYYYADHSGPSLSYASTAVAFDRWNYDFQSGQWEYSPD